jgi:hypothetical protein
MNFKNSYPSLFHPRAPHRTDTATHRKKFIILALCRRRPSTVTARRPPCRLRLTPSALPPPAGPPPILRHRCPTPRQRPRAAPGPSRSPAPPRALLVTLAGVEVFFVNLNLNLTKFQ